MKKIFLISFILFIFIFFISCITTFVVYSGQSFMSSSTEYSFSNCDYSWPLPTYHTVSSYFGFRISPTSGASNYHSGIDIPAPERYKYLFGISWHCFLLGFSRRKWLYHSN